MERLAAQGGIRTVSRVYTQRLRSAETKQPALRHLAGQILLRTRPAGAVHLRVDGEAGKCAARAGLPDELGELVDRR